jgi:hypothetical protein
MLDREELIEQAYFFRVVGERLGDNVPMQELLGSVKEEILATARLPMAIDYLLAELLHSGVMSTAMAKLAHYFTPFQTYVMQEAENDRGRFDFRVALEILRHDADYRAAGGSRQGIFMYQFETLCRNRLKYDPGIGAMMNDPIYDEAWRGWLDYLRRQIGFVDLGDMIFIRSEYSLVIRRRRGERDPQPEQPLLFGEREGKIALANRQKDPLLLFAALQRQLGYPAVPRLKPFDDAPQLLPQLARRLERMEHRLKLMEEEQQAGSIDITRFYQGPPPKGVPLE